MDNYTLKLFLHLAESLGFSKTSEACHISPSALSRQIQRLEEELGVKLFIRDNRSVELTYEGTLFRTYASDVLSRWEAFENELNRERGVLRGEIRIYCSVTACYGILPPILEEFRRGYPGITIKLTTGDAADAIPRVLNQEADLTIAAMPEVLPPNVVFEKITETPLKFWAPRQEAHFSKTLEKWRIPWNEIPFILPERGPAEKRIRRWFSRKQMEPNVYARVSGNEAILAMIRLGFGVGVVPALVVENSIFRSGVRELEVSPPLKPYSVGVCTLTRRLQSPCVKAFWDVCGL